MLASARDGAIRRRRDRGVLLAVFVALALTTLLVAGLPAASVAQPLPPGTYTTATPDGDVVLTVARDGDVDVAAPAALAVELAFDAESRVLDTFTVTGTSGAWSVTIDVDDEGGYVVDVVPDDGTSGAPPWPLDRPAPDTVPTGPGDGPLAPDDRPVTDPGPGDEAAPRSTLPDGPPGQDRDPVGPPDGAGEAQEPPGQADRDQPPGRADRDEPPSRADRDLPPGRSEGAADASDGPATPQPTPQAPPGRATARDRGTPDAPDD